MKKLDLLFGILALMILVVSCNNKGTNKQESSGFTIKGNINGIPSGTVKIIPDINYHPSKAVDSAAIANGSFELKGIIGVPQMMTLVIDPGNWICSVFIEDTILHISIDTAGAFHYDYTKYGDDKGAYIKNYSETGSANYDAWKQFQDDPRQKQYDPALAVLHAKFEAAKDKAGKYKVMDQMDSVRKLLRTWQINWIDSFVSRNPSSVAGAYMFYNVVHRFYQSIPVVTIEKTVNKYRGEAKASVYYKVMAISLAKIKAVQPGSVAPNFTLLKKDSSKFTLSSTRGKYTMIDFWASWCLPCCQAIPHWKEVYKKYRDREFDIVGVACDRQWSNWIKALNQEKMPWLQVNDEFPDKNNPLGKVGGLYLTNSIPFYVLLNKEGKILLYTDDENKIDAKLEEIFGS